MMLLQSEALVCWRHRLREAAKIEAAQKAAVATVQHFDARLQAIDLRLANLERFLIEAQAVGSIGPTVATVNNPDPGKPQ